jgi:hypothetical protein
LDNVHTQNEEKEPRYYNPPSVELTAAVGDAEEEGSAHSRPVAEAVKGDEVDLQMLDEAAAEIAEVDFEDGIAEQESAALAEPDCESAGITSPSAPSVMDPAPAAETTEEAAPVSTVPSMGI